MIEARDANALSRGMQGMSVRIARALNRLMKRRGTVFADRHHERILRSPKEVRYALHDTLNNAKKHGIGPRARGSVDALSSAPWFEGWSRAVRFDETRPRARIADGGSAYMASASWMERGGGLLDPDRRPGPARRAAATRER